MDDIVLKSLAKWPNVPACYGWLAFDRRGNWRMRNEFAQANGLPGDPIRHEALLAFIARNYEQDTEGQWFFQNGPQRVFIELDYTPWVVRLHPDGHDGLTWRTSTDAPFAPTACWTDEHGNILLEGRVGEMTANSIALLHDGDLGLFTQLASLYGNACGALGHVDWQGQRWLIEAIAQGDVPKQFGFVLSPLARQATLASAS